MALFLNDILSKVGIQVAHIYRIEEYSKGYMHLTVALQQIGEIPKMMLKKNHIVSNRNYSRNYEDWRIKILTKEGIIETISIGIISYHDERNIHFKECYRIDIRKDSIVVESENDMIRIPIF